MPSDLGVIREAMSIGIKARRDAAHREASAGYDGIARSILHAADIEAAALDRLAPLPDDAVLVGLTREDWERVIHVLNLSADIAAGKKSRIAADIRRQTGEGGS